MITRQQAIVEGIRAADEKRRRQEDIRRPDSDDVARFGRWLDDVDATELETWADLERAELDAAMDLANIIHRLMVHEGWTRGEVLGVMEGHWMRSSHRPGLTHSKSQKG